MHFLFTLRGDSRHGIVTRPQVRRPRNRGTIPRRDNKFISSPKPPDLCWRPPNLLFNVTETTQQSGQTPDKEVDINHITVYVSGYTETDTTGMLSPNNGRLSGSNIVGLFPATVWSDTCCSAHRIRVLLQWTKVSTRTFRDMRPLWDQRDKNYHNRDLKPKIWDEIGEKINVAGKY